MMISDMLNDHSDISAFKTANNGKEAVEMTKLHRPDVVVMDVNMGQYDGLYAVEKIMQQNPTPIIMLSAIGNTNLSPILDAIELGAFDYLNKPSSSNIKIKDVGNELVEKIKLAASSNIKIVNEVKRKEVIEPHTFTNQIGYDIIVVGASTGGPSAVEQVICKLPSNLEVPVLIAQHMPENFIPSFAQRLNRLSPLDVKVASLGAVLKPKTVYVAPGQHNTIVRKNNNKVEIGFTAKRFPDFNFPSISALMTSVSKVYGSRAIGLILTGMGKDGCTGIMEIKDAGGLTIAQNEETSVVFGMPKEAINSGKIDHIIPLDQIGFFLTNCLE